MEPHVIVAVVLGSALHAGWNAVVKIGTDRLIAVTLISSFSGTIGAAATPFVVLLCRLEIGCRKQPKYSAVRDWLLAVGSASGANIASA